VPFFSLAFLFFYNRVMNSLHIPRTFIPDVNSMVSKQPKLQMMAGTRTEVTGPGAGAPGLLGEVPLYH
jgi:hypothetical protein